MLTHRAICGWVFDDVANFPPFSKESEFPSANTQWRGQNCIKFGEDIELSSTYPTIDIYLNFSVDYGNCFVSKQGWLKCERGRKLKSSFTQHGCRRQLWFWPKVNFYAAAASGVAYCITMPNFKASYWCFSKFVCPFRRQSFRSVRPISGTGFYGNQQCQSTEGVTVVIYF